MRWADENDAGIAAAPAHSSPDVLDHVSSRDELVYEAGDAARCCGPPTVLASSSDWTSGRVSHLPTY